MIDVLLEALAGNGVLGVILAVMLWFNYKVVNKLFDVIKANTESQSNSSKTQEAVIKVIEENTNVIRGGRESNQSHMEQSTRTHNEIHLIKKEVDDIGISVDSLSKENTVLKNIIESTGDEIKSQIKEKSEETNKLIDVSLKKLDELANK